MEILGWRHRMAKYTFRPYRPLDEPPRTWRDWPGWYGVAAGIWILVLVLVVLVRGC